MTQNDRFVHKTEPPPSRVGSLHAVYVRCGKASCRCARGELHGPYWRQQWREGGRTQRRYVRQADAARLQAELEVWRVEHPSLGSLRQQLTELRRLARLLGV